MSVVLILGETLQQCLEEPWMVTLYALHEHCISILCVFGVSVCIFRFFFSLHVNSKLIWFTVQGTKITVYILFINVHSTVHELKNIKNGSHGTIHTFKNYFVTVLLIFSFQFLVFSFSNNKFNPNKPFEVNAAENVVESWSPVECKWCTAITVLVTTICFEFVLVFLSILVKP